MGSDLLDRAGNWLSRALTFGAWFLGTFFALIIAWALTETLTPFRFGPLAVRYAVFAGMLLLSFVTGIFFARRPGAAGPPYRDKRVLRQDRASFDAPDVNEAPRTDPISGASPLSRRLDAIKMAAVNEAGFAPNPVAAPRAPDEALEQARYRPIVFRQLYPPPADAGLSFYGGAPIGPVDFVWPYAETRNGNAPLHFVIQWDCAELSAQDATGLLPRDGALYLFCDLEWGDPMSFRFIHAPGPVHNWAQLPLPSDLGPAFGSEGAWMAPYVVPKSIIDGVLQQGPKLLPRWPFKPVAIDHQRSDDAASLDPDDESPDDESGVYWSGDGEALLAAQNALGAPLATFSAPRENAFARPYPAFPQDWAAVRIVCAKAIDLLSRPYMLSKYHFLPEADEAARTAAMEQWLGEAQELYAQATKYPLEAALPKEISDQIWTWIELIQSTFAPSFNAIVEESVNVSLGLGSEGVSRIAPEWIADNSRKHMLAREYMRDEYRHEFLKQYGADLSSDEAEAAWKHKVEQGDLKKVRELFAPTPSHMFGPPSHVQEDIDEYASEWLLLLEMVSQRAMGRELGEGVMQFFILPDDLRAGRFEKAKFAFSSH